LLTIGIVYVNRWRDQRTAGMDNSSAPRTIMLMFRSWFRGRLRRAAAKGAREDLLQFVESLRGLSDVQIGAAVAAAAVARVALRETGVLSDELLRITRDPLQVTTQLAISQLVRGYQAEQKYREATGALVWLHSLQALSFPELRSPGREMWRQLRRGQTHALRLLREMGVSQLSDEAFECARVPDDLDSSDRA
jgi:hypothetical protein